jgi:hypothetical protein
VAVLPAERLAGHVSAIVSGLAKRYGYRPRGSEWLTVSVPPE